MSVISPEIDDLLEKTDHNPFLLCSVASRRAADMNNMIRGQHLRVTAVQDFDDVTVGVSGMDTISLAMEELNDGTLGYVQENFKKNVDTTNTFEV